MMRPSPLTRVWVGAVASTGLAICLTGCGSQPPANASQSVTKPSTAIVRMGDLTQSVTAPGQLGYGTTRPLNSGLGGVVTGMPAVGQTIDTGDVAYSVNMTPVVRFAGTVPAWRPLGPGVSDGPDVKQLEDGLAALGYGRNLAVDQHWTDGTTAAVKAWQKALGIPRTGSVPLGQVIFSASPLRVVSTTANVGDTVAPGAPIETVSGTERVVSASTGVANQSLAPVDGRLSLSFPNGRTVTGRVVGVRFVPGDENHPDSIKLTIALPPEEWIADVLAGASVTVTMSKVVVPNTLIVPVTALVPLANGQYGVQQVVGATTRYIEVKPGPFSNTDVAVTSPSLKAGDKVVVAAQ